MKEYWMDEDLLKLLIRRYKADFLDENHTNIEKKTDYNTKKRKIQKQVEDPVTLPQRQKLLNEKPLVKLTDNAGQTLEKLISPVAEELVCAICRSWMASQQVRFCECKLICSVCSHLTTRCEDCGLAFAEDKRLSTFHERLCRLIDRPCLYQSAGCSFFVKAGDEHESSCDYKPSVCFKCIKEIPNINAKEHFEIEHHLNKKNHNVKVSDFYLDPKSGLREVCCLPTRDQRVYLTLNKSELDENAQFIVNSGDSDAKVTLLFKKDSVFHYECDNKTNDDQLMFDRSGLSFIDVSKKAINYWFKDECVLDISIRIKKQKDDKNMIKDQIKYNKRSVKQTSILENHTNIEKKTDYNTKKRKIQKQVEDPVTLPQRQKLLNEKPFVEVNR